MASQEEWARRLAQVFSAHYVRVIRSVQAGIVMDTDERLSDVIDQARAAQLVDRALFHARRVVARLDTLATEAHAASMLTKDAARPGNTVTVIGWMKNAWRKFARQIGVIANLQTQEVAEETAQALRTSGLAPFLTQGGEVVVEWVTRLDERVRGNPDGIYKNSRFDHWSAHGQRAKLPGGVFTVSGEQMRMPGDTGLGASLGNIISCRCGLRTIWIKPDGTEEVIEDRILNPSREPTKPRKPGFNPNAWTRTKPTTSFAFGYGRGPWRGRLILGNGQMGNYTVRDGGVTIRVGGKPVASAPLGRDSLGNWTLGRVTTSPGYEDVGIDEMLRQSIINANIRRGK